MTIFSELYGKYYSTVFNILEKAHNNTIDINLIRDIVLKNGFLESTTSLLPNIISQDSEGYNLLIKVKDEYESILKNKPQNNITDLELSWIKTLLSDYRIQLFLDDDDYYHIKKLLLDIPSLFISETIMYARQNQNSYIENRKIKYIFKEVNTAIQNYKIIKVKLFNNKNDFKKIVPYKLEYNIKNDDFNLIGIEVENNVLVSLKRISLIKINDIVIENKLFTKDKVDIFLKQQKCKEPIYFEVSNNRSGFERVFMYISPYETSIELDEKTGKCYVKLYYYSIDEKNLTDMLISFGSIVRIIKPDHIKDLFRDKIYKQYNYFANFFSQS